MLYKTVKVGSYPTFTYLFLKELLTQVLHG